VVRRSCFDGSANVHPFVFYKDLRGIRLAEPVQPDHRGVADGVQNCIVYHKYLPLFSRFVICCQNIISPPRRVFKKFISLWYFLRDCVKICLKEYTFGMVGLWIFLKGRRFWQAKALWKN